MVDLKFDVPGRLAESVVLTYAVVEYWVDSEELWKPD